MLRRIHIRIVMLAKLVLNLMIQGLPLPMSATTLTTTTVITCFRMHNGLKYVAHHPLESMKVVLYGAESRESCKTVRRGKLSEERHTHFQPRPSRSTPRRPFKSEEPGRAGTLLELNIGREFAGVVSQVGLYSGHVANGTCLFDWDTLV